jgi:hypothetical protein
MAIVTDMKIADNNHLLDAYTEGNDVDEELSFSRHMPFYRKIESIPSSLVEILPENLHLLEIA